MTRAFIMMQQSLLGKKYRPATTAGRYFYIQTEAKS
jgi:hypothetical protein